MPSTEKIELTKGEISLVFRAVGFYQTEVESLEKKAEKLGERKAAANIGTTKGELEELKQKFL